MLNENTKLIGQVLQIRDKLVAKRHAVPSDLQSEWKKLIDKTACFDASQTLSQCVKGSPAKKPATFTGSASDLMSLVSRLNDFNLRISGNTRH
ncbi:hypothetical protein [Alteromonas sp. H39]|uniref:hypothetical protein n=1 Tax=Alteromonas sp. H39 TaxID=3389876 RepID=UPI0039DF98E8